MLKIVILICLIAAQSFCAEPTWKLHVIDDTSKGADGVRLGDINQDGLPDIATGFEQGSVTKVFIHPGYKQTKKAWPQVRVGKTKTVEDAFFSDVNGDGVLDVISSSEGDPGKGQKMTIQFAPKDLGKILDSNSWSQGVISSSVDKMKFMYGVPLQIDGLNGKDLIVAGKRGGAQIGWYSIPDKSSDMSAYKYSVIDPKVGWIMSLQVVDMNADGILDLLVSDRKGKGDSGGIAWYKNPGPTGDVNSPWIRQQIYKHNNKALGRKGSYKFLSHQDIDGDGLKDIAFATTAGIVVLKNLNANGQEWAHTCIWLDDINCGNPKAAAIADINKDGKMDIAFTCEGAKEKNGVMWMEYGSTPFSDQGWKFHPISGVKLGVKYDRIEMLDLDNDGDLDLLTCEELQGKNGLGVIWYENPQK